MNKMIRSIAMTLVGLGGLGAVAGCESNAGNGALIGGAAGAGLGAIIGHNSHGRTAGGALIGGAVGAAAGGLIGNEADKQEARERDRYHDDRRPARYDGPYRDDAPTEYRYYDDGPRRVDVYRETRVYRGY